MTRVGAIVVAVGLPGLAWAHHGTGTTQVTPPTLPAPTVQASGEDRSAQVGLRYDLAHLDRRVQDTTRVAAEHPVAMHRATLTGGLTFPGQRSVGLAVPVGLVHGADEDSYGAGDVSVWIGQGVGSGVRLQVEGGLTAPTGSYARTAAHAELDVQGLADGRLLMATYATRTSLGAGSWSAQGRAALRVPLGTATARGYGAWSEPLDRTPDGFRWGRSVVAGGAAVSPPVGPVTVSLGADRRWHQTDRFAFIEEETGAPVERPVGKRASTGLTAAVSVALSQRASCRLDGYRLVGQRAAGIQLMASTGVGLGCALTLPTSRGRLVPGASVDQAGASTAPGRPVSGEGEPPQALTE